jgi:hypothetical protein
LLGLALGCSSNYYKTPFCSSSCNKYNFEQICPQFSLIDKLLK